MKKGSRPDPGAGPRWIWWIWGRRALLTGEWRGDPPPLPGHRLQPPPAGQGAARAGFLGRARPEQGQPRGPPPPGPAVGDLGLLLLRLALLLRLLRGRLLPLRDEIVRQGRRALGGPGILSRGSEVGEPDHSCEEGTAQGKGRVSSGDKGHSSASAAAGSALGILHAVDVPALLPQKDATAALTVQRRKVSLRKSRAGI